MIKTKLRKLRESEPIPLESVDFSIDDPFTLDLELGDTLSYFARVENEVAADPLTTMMPRLGTEYSGYESYGMEFLDIWVPQETAHGLIFDELQRQLGREPLVPDVDVSRTNRLGGLASGMSPWFHGVLEMVYLTRGTMHERLTLQGYNLMGKKLEKLGEKALLETVVKPIKPQEAGHLSYYREAAGELKAHLTPRQLNFARWISLKTYAPVGARNEQQVAHFGQVAQQLTGGELEEFAAPIQSIAEDLLVEKMGEQDDPALPLFVIESLRQSVTASRQLPTIAA